LHHEKLVFIEEVGTNIGIGYKVFNYIDNFPYLLCAYKYDTKIYQNDHPDYRDVCVLVTANTEPCPDNSTIRIFPNPTTGIINVDLKIPLQYRFQITDLLGRSLEKGLISGSQLDLSGYPDGIYVITVWPEPDRTEKQHFKVIKY
jgi:hypothetical protein